VCCCSSSPVAKRALANIKELLELVSQAPHVQKVVWVLSPRKPTYSDEKWQFMNSVAEGVVELLDELDERNCGTGRALETGVWGLRSFSVNADHLCMDRVHLNKRGHREKALHLRRLKSVGDATDRDRWIIGG